jgi:hypothetical protein
MLPSKAKRRVIYALAAFVAVSLSLAYVFDVSLWASPSDREASACQQHQVISKGDSPGGVPWSFRGSIRENGEGCDAWLLKLEFRPERKPYSHKWESEAGLSRMPGSFNWAWGIPTGGHLPDNFTMVGRDEYEGSERVFAGATGARVVSVTLTMSTGRHILIRPILPELALRRKFAWLRNVRYFVRYYPLGEHVRTVTVRNAAGRVTKIAGQEGAFNEQPIR